MPLMGFRRWLVVCVAAIGALFAAAGPASAHAELVSSSPAGGAVVVSEPAQVTLRFSEDVVLRLSAVKVIGPDGHRLDTGSLHAGEDSLTADLVPDARKGTFVIVWQVTAADDGHASSGTLTFAVGAPSPAAHVALAHNRWTTALADLAQWAGFLGLALVGGYATLRPGEPLTTRPVAVGWAILLTATVLHLLAYAPASRGVGPCHLFDRGLLSATLPTREGHALMARLVILAVAAAVGDAVLRRAHTPIAPLTFTLAVAATWGMTGHASTGSAPPLAMISLTLHVAAMALWTGGLVTVALILITDRSPLAATAKRFSRLAIAAVGVLVVTGLHQAWRELGSVSALTDTAYGRLLLLKVVVFLFVLAVASRSRDLVTRWRAGNEATLRISVLIELAGAAALLLLAVLLSGSAPPR